MNKAELQQFFETMDIRVWYGNHVTCPTCGINLREMTPSANLVRHWARMCIDPPEPRESIESPPPSIRQTWWILVILLAFFGGCVLGMVFETILRNGFGK
jgi:hypothetical protein